MQSVYTQESTHTSFSHSFHFQHQSINKQPHTGLNSTCYLQVLCGWSVAVFCHTISYGTEQKSFYLQIFFCSTKTFNIIMASVHGLGAYTCTNKNVLKLFQKQIALYSASPFYCLICGRFYTWRKAVCLFCCGVQYIY